MRKFLRYEITTAIKDRPRIFQFITLSLFSFSLTIILVMLCARIYTVEIKQNAYRQAKAPEYSDFVIVPAKHQFANFKK